MTGRLLGAAAAGTAAGALLLAVLQPRRCELVVPGGLPWWVALLPLLLALVPLVVAVVQRRARVQGTVLAVVGVGVLLAAYDPFGTYDCYLAG